MKNNISDINRIVNNGGLSDLISDSNRIVNVQIENLVRLIEAKTKSFDEFSGVIYLTGPSSSGKTTFTEILTQKMEELLNVDVTFLSLDDFYRTVTETIEIEKEMGMIPSDAVEGNYETIEAFNVKALRKVIRSFIAGKETRCPKFNFVTRKSEKDGKIIKRTGRDLLIIEGIQTFNPTISAGINPDFSLKVYVCPFDTYVSSNGKILTPQMVRFMRRANRDVNMRNAGIRKTLEMWPTVRKGEESYMKPLKKDADVFINTSFIFEPCFLSWKILGMLSTLTPEELKIAQEYVDEEILKEFAKAEIIPKTEKSIFDEFNY